MTATVLLDRVLAWAGSEPDVVAVVLTGSRASVRRSPDRWSDVDVELICDDPTRLIDDDSWLHRFGEVLVYLRLWSEEETHQTRLVAYAEGEADFSLCDRERITGQSSSLTDLYRRGYRVLLDKEDLTGVLPAADGRPEPKPLPSEDGYRYVVSNFWLEAYHMPGYLARGDLWAAKFRDGTMKKCLRQMLEWSAMLRNPDADVRHIGHGMRDWVDEETWAALHEVWGGFDADSSRKALVATVREFNRAGRHVAAGLGFTYPDEAARAIAARFETTA